MDNLTIRQALLSDVDRIVELRLLSQEHFEKSNPLIWRMSDEGSQLLRQKVEGDFADSNIRVLLAEASGKTIGFIQGEITKRTDYLPKTVGHISLIFVMKEFGRRGIGARLVMEICRFFNSNEAEYLTVRYILGNTEAEIFWNELGFEPIITTSTTYQKDLDLKLKGLTGE